MLSEVQNDILTQVKSCFKEELKNFSSEIIEIKKFSIPIK